MHEGHMPASDRLTQDICDIFYMKKTDTYKTKRNPNNTNQHQAIRRRMEGIKLPLERDAEEARALTRTISLVTKRNDNSVLPMEDDDVAPGPSNPVINIPPDYTHTPARSGLRNRERGKAITQSKKKDQTKRVRSSSPSKKQKKKKKQSPEPPAPTTTTISEGGESTYIDEEGVMWEGPIMLPSTNRMEDILDTEDPVQQTAEHLMSQLEDRGVVSRYQISPRPEGWRVDYRVRKHHKQVQLITSDEEGEDMDATSEPIQRSVEAGVEPTIETWDFLRKTYSYPSRYTEGERTYDLASLEISKEVLKELWRPNEWKDFFLPPMTDADRALFALLSKGNPNSLRRLISPSAFKRIDKR
uniref:Uncharacterized protein n=1 Tax=Lobos virus TaxID=3139875 RepID=A0AAN0LXC1_9VIRU